MRFSTLAFLILLLIVPLPGAAADIAGKWTAQTLMGSSGSEQAIATTFDFQVDGAMLTGTVESPRGRYEILDGKVEGDSVVFAIQLTGGGAKLKYDGRISADGIDFISKIDGTDRSDHFLAARPSE
jgi:hypothetical protein